MGYKKLAAAIAVAGIIFALLVPSMRQAVLFQDQANQNRLRLWGYSWTFLTDSPKNFVLGTGVRQFFRKIQKPYYDVRVMERLIYPHNIFLNFWTEIGLSGMLSVGAILGYVLYVANKIRLQDKIIGAGLMAMLATLVVHGLVDVPYFKKRSCLFILDFNGNSVFFSMKNIYQSQADVISGKSGKKLMEHIL
jgi:O-antigen ligase